MSTVILFKLFNIIINKWQSRFLVLLLIIVLLYPFAISTGYEPVSVLQIWPKTITPGTSVNQNDYLFIRYTNPEFEEIKIKIFDINGCLVKNVSTNNPAAGNGIEWVLKWDGKNDSDEYVAPGVYIYQFESRSALKTGTICVAR